MSGEPARRWPTIVGVIAALATVVFANLGMATSATVAAVCAIACVAEAWRRRD